MNKLKAAKPSYMQTPKERANNIIKALREWMSVEAIENWITGDSITPSANKRRFCDKVPKEYHPNHYLEYRLSIGKKLGVRTIVLRLKAWGKDGLGEEIAQGETKLFGAMNGYDKNLEATSPKHLPDLNLLWYAGRLANALIEALPNLTKLETSEPAETQNSVEMPEKDGQLSVKRLGQQNSFLPVQPAAVQTGPKKGQVKMDTNNYQQFVRESRDKIASWIADPRVEALFAADMKQAESLLQTNEKQCQRITDQQRQFHVSPKGRKWHRENARWEERWEQAHRIDVREVQPAPGTQGRPKIPKILTLEPPKGPLGKFILRIEPATLTVNDYRVLLGALHDGFTWHECDKSQYICPELSKKGTIVDVLFWDFMWYEPRYKTLIEEALRIVERDINDQEQKNEPQEKGGQGDKDSKEQTWNENDHNYIPLSEAIEKFAENKIPMPTISKQIKYDGPIRYMRKGRRCRVHMGDFREFTKQKYPTIGIEGEAAAEFIADVEAKKKEAQHRKQRYNL